jgi:DNA-binding CsgD family transcriptional regulator
MRQAPIFFYFACLVVGFSSMISLSTIAAKTRHPFFGRYLVFDAFFTLLIAALTVSLYLEADLPSAYEAGGPYLRLFIYLIKCALAYALIGFIDFLFAVGKRKLIEVSVFLVLLGMAVVRLIGFYDLIPESEGSDPTSWPITRVAVDGLIVLAFLFLFFLRAFRLDKVAPEEFVKLTKRLTLVIAVFSPAIILEILFYKQWGWAPFSPAMYATINLIFVFHLTGFFLRNYRSSGDNFRKAVDGKDSPLGPFLEKYGISKREEEIVLCLLNGKTNREIADQLFISASTVKAHVYNIFRKASVKTRHQLFFTVLNRN